MVRRLAGIGLAVLAAVGLAAEPPKASPQDAAKTKKALGELQEFVGVWNLEGTRKVGAKTEAWKEKVSWGWKFQDGDSRLTVDFAGGKGKHYARGDLTYLPAGKKYVLTLTGADKTEQVYEGGLKAGVLRLDRKDPATGDVHRVTANTAADGVRLILKWETQAGGKGVFAPAFQMAGSRDGESIAKTAKKPECVVTGGAATIAVSYGGQTYYVCCTGCRDAFTAAPEKFVKGK
ncbi:MAG: YHS domain-containing protein [Gemmataceae bacterium]|nr:YHS domain-containing protein [Gemmataceae bacterium]